MATDQTTQAPQVADDPMDAATHATLAPRSYYGQIEVDAWFVVLVKGVGKEVYDPGKHSSDQRRTAIKISLLPIAEQNVQFALERDMIAESREWAGVVLPSLKAIGIGNVREANGRWARMQQVGTGRMYRNGKGEEREATTFKFTALYKDEAECRAAYLADTGAQSGNGNGNGHSAAPTSGAPTPAAAPGNGAGNGKSALDMARPFVFAFAKQHSYDIEKTRAACRAQAIITRAIDVDSEQFVNLVAEAMAAGSK